jgi:hypothetical protein
MRPFAVQRTISITPEADKYNFEHPSNIPVLKPQQYFLTFYRSLINEQQYILVTRTQCKRGAV